MANQDAFRCCLPGSSDVTSETQGATHPRPAKVIFSQNQIQTTPQPWESTAMAEPVQPLPVYNPEMDAAYRKVASGMWLPIQDDPGDETEPTALPEPPESPRKRTLGELWAIERWGR